MHCARDLITLFNGCFLPHFNTVLQGGAAEPVYLPAQGPQTHHRVIFTRDYFASALHETAHWCIAGTARRQQEDYGYWYAPDGRNAQQQLAFEKVEIKPQAMEWIFARAAGTPFRLSIDNLHGEASASTQFIQDVTQQAQHYCVYGLPQRAAQFTAALCAFYQTGNVLTAENFQEAMLG